MKSNNRGMLAFALLTLLSGAALAGGSKHSPPPKPTPTPAPQQPAPQADADSAAQAAAHAAAEAQAAADAAAEAAAVAAQQQRQSAVAAGGKGGTGTGGAGGNAAGTGTVSVEGDRSTYSSRALALALPGLVAAPPVPGECLEHRAGWGFASGGKTGATKLQALCMEQRHCLAMADRYAAWQRIDLAEQQLQKCGGVPYAPPPPPPSKQPAQITDLKVDGVPATQYLTKDEAIALEKRIIERVTRK